MLNKHLQTRRDAWVYNSLRTEGNNTPMHYLNFNSNRLETLLFNPIEQPELSNSLSSYLNPDSNFIAGLPSSSYLAEDDTNSRVAPLSNKINFPIMHTCVRERHASASAPRSLSCFYC